MTYLRSFELDVDALSNSWLMTPFGRLRTAHPANRLDVEFIYDKQPNLCDEITLGTGTVVHQANTRDLLIDAGGITAGDQAEIRTYPVPYTAGNGQLVEITGTINRANIAGTMEVFVRSKISGSVVETTYDQSTWDSNTTGVNWDDSQIFAMDFQSLKVGRIRFGLVQDGVATVVKEVYNDNVRDSGYWQMPAQPVRWLVRNYSEYQEAEISYGDNDNAIGFRFKTSVKDGDFGMRAICATVKSEGGEYLQDIPGFTRSVSRGTSVKTIGNTLVPLISIRPRSTFRSYVNKALCMPTGFEISTDNPLYYQVLKDASLTGASWGKVDTAESFMESDINATVVTGGTIIKDGYIYNNRNPERVLEGLPMWDRAGSTPTGILTIACVRLNVNCDTYGGFTWKEIR